MEKAYHMSSNCYKETSECELVNAFFRYSELARRGIHTFHINNLLMPNITFVMPHITSNTVARPPSHIFSHNFYLAGFIY
jgi:hypothetical protein